MHTIVYYLSARMNRMKAFHPSPSLEPIETANGFFEILLNREDVHASSFEFMRLACCGDDLDSSIRAYRMWEMLRRFGNRPSAGHNVWPMLLEIDSRFAVRLWSDYVCGVFSAGLSLFGKYWLSTTTSFAVVTIAVLDEPDRFNLVILGLAILRKHGFGNMPLFVMAVGANGIQSIDRYDPMNNGSSTRFQSDGK